MELSARATQTEPKSPRDTHVLEDRAGLRKLGFNGLLLERQVRHREPEHAARGRAIARRSLGGARGSLGVSLVIHGDAHTNNKEDTLSSSFSKGKKGRQNSKTEINKKQLMMGVR